ncbi:MAG: carbamoyltransferase [Kiritimatiellaeota bacterium]|nr:carbamoyltransferase [Kiritimatiellota bacterium]
MNIIGVSAYYHDSAAALIVDGEIAAAAQEERFTRLKHDPAYPVNAVEFCLNRAGLKFSDIDYFLFYDKPILKFERLLETYLAYAPLGYASFSRAIPLWLKRKLNIRREIRGRLSEEFIGKLLFPEHHESHAASAFFPSPFEEAAIMTIDGVGEWATATLAKGVGNKLEFISELRFPHSLGLLYSAFTYHTGFRVNSGEYKLMGLAPYGEPRYAERIREKLVDIREDGSIWMDMSYFNYCQGLTMTSSKFDKLFGPPRHPESGITQREMDMAASVQDVTEEIVLKMARHAREATGSKNLCMAGGVALNCVANGKILREGIFDNVWIQPAAGDAGGALGAALLCWHQLLNRERVPDPGDSQFGSLLGPAYSNDEIKKYLDDSGAKYEYMSKESVLLERVASLMSAGNVVGWFHGRMEFGPRALGARSIIGDPRNSRMQATMNLKIKYRESFRPFAPCVLAEDASDYFDLECESPYMLLVAPVKEERRRTLTDDERKLMADSDLRKRVNIARSEIPAVTHVDYSARVQTVDERRHGRYYRLIKRFKSDTGCPVIINTSFNIRGEPIVNTPEDAFNCFINTEMDVLVLENCLLLKKEQTAKSDADREAYQKSFNLD